MEFGGATDTAVVEVVERARIAWSLPLLGSFVGAAVAEDGTVYAASSHGLQAVGPEGGERWSVPGYLVRGTPAIAKDGTIYLGSWDGVTAIDPGGTVRWIAPAVGLNGTIYAGTHDGEVNELHAFEEVGRNNGGWGVAPWPQDRGDRANSGRARNALSP